MLMHTHARPGEPAQLLKAEEDSETDARWSVHVRQSGDPYIVCVQCAHGKFMRGDRPPFGQGYYIFSSGNLRLSFSHYQSVSALNL